MFNLSSGHFKRIYQNFTALNPALNPRNWVFRLAGSRQKALADLQSMQTEKLEKLSDKQSQPESQLKFIIEAWLQIVECRRVLKWTYAYGYYLPEHDHAKRQFFEYLQGEAESGLERLHQCTEKDLQVYLDSEVPMKDFNDFRTKLAGLTRNYFENLVRALETGLKDVGSTNQPARAQAQRLWARERAGRRGWLGLVRGQQPKPQLRRK